MWVRIAAVCLRHHQLWLQSFAATATFSFGQTVRHAFSIFLYGEAVCFPSAGTLTASPYSLAFGFARPLRARSLLSGVRPDRSLNFLRVEICLRRQYDEQPAIECRAGLAVFASADFSLGGAAVFVSDFAGAFSSAGLAAGAFFESSMGTTSPDFYFLTLGTIASTRRMFRPRSQSKLLSVSG